MELYISSSFFELTVLLFSLSNFYIYIYIYIYNSIDPVHHTLNTCYYIIKLSLSYKASLL